MKSLKSVLFPGIVLALLLSSVPAYAAGILLYYPPEWKNDAPKAKEIAETLGQSSGLEIQPRIANSYPEIVDAFAKSEPTLVYVGSFVQALLHARGQSVPLLQAINGKELYTSVLIAPKSAGNDPVAIVKEAGADVAYAKGASSGESGAKAATEGAAAIAANNHSAAVNAVKAGKAKCAFVKNWWWEANKANFEDMEKFDFPGVSDHKNSDNVLSANKSVSAEDTAKIKAAALSNAKVFGVDSLAEFNPAALDPTLDLMKKAKIDPQNYTW